MDVNTIVLAGKLAADPTVTWGENGITSIRYLLTVRSEQPTRRVDVIPVMLYQPDEEPKARRGDRAWVAGRLIRRFFGSDSNYSELQVVAIAVEFKTTETKEVVHG